MGFLADVAAVMETDEGSLSCAGTAPGATINARRRRWRDLLFAAVNVAG